MSGGTGVSSHDVISSSPPAPATVSHASSTDSTGDARFLTSPGCLSLSVEAAGPVVPQPNVGSAFSPGRGVKVHLHGQPKAGDVAELDRAAIDGDEAMDDGQSESAAGRRVTRRAVGRLGPEPAEGLVALGRCHAGSAVDDLQPDAVVVLANRDGDLSVPGGHVKGVGQEIVENLLEVSR